MTRLRFLLLVPGLALAVAACGSSPTVDGGAAAAAVEVPERDTSVTDGTLAGRSTEQFGNRLFGAARATAQDPTANLTVSPTSVAIALAMVEPGAVGEASTQLRDLLAIDDPAAYHAAMNALELALEARQPAAATEGGDPGEVTVRVANAAYLQQDYPFEPAYLEAIGTNYGPVLNEVDFRPDPDAVAHTINAFVADTTEDRITDLIADGVIDPATVLALVNALYLKASWLEDFEPGDTGDAPFTRLDGTEVTVPMMRGTSSWTAEGDGWRGGAKAYVGQLEVQFVLPDEGRFDEVADDLDTVWTTFAATRQDGAELGLPRFETRTNLALDDALRSLGLTAPYQPGGLLGIAPAEKLVIDKVLHETWVAMDEEGTEAAAATVVLVMETSAPAEPPQPLILDRPFLYRIVDTPTGAVLFLGQVTDPSAS